MRMSKKRKISVEPLSYAITGINIEDFFKESFKEALQAELTTSALVGILVGFVDSKDMVMLTYQRKEGKFITDHVEIEGTDGKLTRRVLEAIQKVKE